MTLTTPYNFPHKRDESHLLVERARRWFERRADIAAARDVQDDPRFFYRGDLLLVRKSGGAQFVEIKCENHYTRLSTPNLAVERYSDLDKQTPGGPWSSEADFYAHIYTDGLLVVMSRYRLVTWIDRVLAANKRAFVYRQVPNEGYATGTYLIPRRLAREALGDYYREYET